MSSNWQLSRLAAARYALCGERPYLGAALWALRIEPEPTSSVPTVAVTADWVLRWNEEFVAGCGELELQGVLYHEVCHLLRQHFERGEELAPDAVDLWLLATDLEINDDLAAEQVRLPEPAPLPQRFGFPAGETAEQYYAQLREQDEGGLAASVARRARSFCSLAEGGGAGSPTAGGEQGGEQGGARRGARRGAQDGRLSDEQIALLRAAVAGEILEFAKSRGTVPRHIERAAAEILEPRVRWEEELRRVLRGTLGSMSGMVDYSYARPSRRRIPNVVLPRLVRPRVDVGVIVDTSGSMSAQELAQALAEVQGIIRAQGAAVRVYPTDAAVHGVQRVCSARDVRLIGGGGTDMTVGIRRAEEERNDVIVVITDGWTPWPDRPPRQPVIVVLTDPSIRWSVPEWARVVVAAESASDLDEDEPPLGTPRRPVLVDGDMVAG